MFYKLGTLKAREKMLDKNWFYIGYSPKGSKTLFIPEEKPSIVLLEELLDGNTKVQETFRAGLAILMIVTAKNGTRHYFTE